MVEEEECLKHTKNLHTQRERETKADDMKSTTSTRNGGGESGAGAPAVRPQHVKVRVEESQPAVVPSDKAAVGERRS